MAKSQLNFRLESVPCLDVLPVWITLLSHVLALCGADDLAYTLKTHRLPDLGPNQNLVLFSWHTRMIRTRYGSRSCYDNYSSGDVLKDKLAPCQTMRLLESIFSSLTLYIVCTLYTPHYDLLRSFFVPDSLETSTQEATSPICPHNTLHLRRELRVEHTQ